MCVISNCFYLCECGVAKLKIILLTIFFIDIRIDCNLCIYYIIKIMSYIKHKKAYTNKYFYDMCDFLNIHAAQVIAYTFAGKTCIKNIVS